MDSRNHVIFLNITLRYSFVFLLHHLPNRIAIASKNVSIKPDKYTMGLFFCFIFLIRKIYDLTSWSSGERKLVNTYHLFRASQVALMAKNPPANAGDKRHKFDPCVGKILLRRAWQSTHIFFPGECPWTEEPGELQSIGSQRVGHNGSDLAHNNHLSGASLVAQTVKYLPAMLDFPGSSDGKAFVCNAGDLGSIPG